MVTLNYMPGFGNDFETEALPGALPQGQNTSAALRLRPLRRAALRFALHRPARHQRALLALSHPARACASTAAAFHDASCPFWKIGTQCLDDHSVADWTVALEPDAHAPSGNRSISSMASAP